MKQIRAHQQCPTVNILFTVNDNIEIYGMK